MIFGERTTIAFFKVNNLSSSEAQVSKFATLS